MTRSALWRSLLAVVVFACASALAQGERAAITELRTQWMAAYNSGDIGAVVALYSLDAHQYLPTGEVLHGPEAIRSWIQTWRDDALSMHDSVTLTLLATRLETMGNSGYEVGAYNLRAGDGTLVDHVCVAMKRSGRLEMWFSPETKEVWYAHRVEAPQHGSTGNGWRIAYHMTTSTMLGQQMAQMMGDGM